MIAVGTLFHAHSDHHIFFDFVFIYFCRRRSAGFCNKCFSLRLITLYLFNGAAGETRFEAYPNRPPLNGRIHVLAAQVDVSVQILHILDSYQPAKPNSINNWNGNICFQLAKCDQNIPHNSMAGFNGTHQLDYLLRRKMSKFNFLPGLWI